MKKVEGLALWWKRTERLSTKLHLWHLWLVNQYCSGNLWFKWLLLNRKHACEKGLITCTLCNKLYIGETGRRLGDGFREHLCDVEKNDKDASKPVARHFNLPNHSKKHMAICGLSLHLQYSSQLLEHLSPFPPSSIVDFQYREKGTSKKIKNKHSAVSLYPYNA